MKFVGVHLQNNNIVSIEQIFSLFTVQVYCIHYIY